MKNKKDKEESCGCCLILLFFTITIVAVVGNWLATLAAVVFLVVALEVSAYRKAVNFVVEFIDEVVRHKK